MVANYIGQPFCWLQGSVYERIYEIIEAFREMGFFSGNSSVGRDFIFAVDMPQAPISKLCPTGQPALGA